MMSVLHVALTLVLLAAVRPSAAAPRALFQYAPAHCEDYTIDGECVNRDGMQVEEQYL